VLHDAIDLEQLRAGLGCAYTSMNFLLRLYKAKLKENESGLFEWLF